MYLKVVLWIRLGWFRGSQSWQSRVNKRDSSIEQMIGLLNAGLGVEVLVDLIAWQIEHPAPMAPVGSSSCWIT